MLKLFLDFLTAAIFALVIYIAVQSSDFNVSKTIVINAKVSDVFAHVNDFHKWNAWSPWARIDPAAKNNIEGMESGIGSVFKWSSTNKEMGEGEMRIVTSVPDKLVKIDLKMTKPVVNTSVVQFILKEEGGLTHVTWAMQAKKGFVAKARGLIFDCEKLVGEQFDLGLNNMKKVVEDAVNAAEPTPDANPAENFPAHLD